jgi:hypothetical protein
VLPTTLQGPARAAGLGTGVSVHNGAKRRVLAPAAPSCALARRLPKRQRRKPASSLSAAKRTPRGTLAPRRRWFARRSHSHSPAFL